MEELNIKEILRESVETLHNFIVVDAAAKVVFISKDYGNLLNVDTEAVVGRPVTEIIPNTRMPLVVRTGQEEIGALITLYDHTQKRDITLVCNRLPIRKHGEVIGALAVTTIKNVEAVDVLYREIHRIQKENQRYRAELEQLKSQNSPLDGIAGCSNAIVAIKRAIEDYAKSNLPILITGETGVGKEVFANAIHQLSNRRLNPYVKINCAAIPADLLEAELFGYADGAFSGASKGGKPGKFELANNGTILLDEIGEMPPAMQAKLLRVLQENEVERVGGTRTIELNLRIICSTNRDIEALANQGLFRKDLYYRINVVELDIPPLRTRREDIRPLCDHFIRRINQEHGLHIGGMSEDTAALLEQRAWPGNVRQLLHAVERAAVLCGRGTLEPTHFTFLKDSREMGEYTVPLTSGGDLAVRREDAERDAILAALERTHWNKSRAAELLGIDRSTLYLKLKRYHIQ